MSYPAKLQQIIDLFEHLPDGEKRETLIAYADQAAAQSPREGEKFDLEDVRKDEECTDTVGVFLAVGPDRKKHADGIRALLVLAHVLQIELFSLARRLRRRLVGIGNERLAFFLLGQMLEEIDDLL
ncbi:MAG: hypothetical protein ACKOB0_05365, partial [Chthoniobacterales bacterium]